MFALQLPALYREIDLDNVNTTLLSDDAMDCVSVATFRLMIVNEHSDSTETKQIRRSIPQQMGTLASLPNVSHLKIVVSFASALLPHGLERPLHAYARIIRCICALASQAVISLEIDARYYGIAEEAKETMFVTLSAIMGPLLTKPHRELYIGYGIEPPSAEVSSSSDFVASPVWSMAATAQVLRLGSLRWLTWLPQDAIFPSLATLKLERGVRPQDISSLRQIIPAVSRLVNQAPFLRELDIGLCDSPSLLSDIWPNLGAHSMKCPSLKSVKLSGLAFYFLAQATRYAPCQALDIEMHRFDWAQLSQVLCDKSSLQKLRKLDLSFWSLNWEEWQTVVQQYPSIRQSLAERGVELDMSVVGPEEPPPLHELLQAIQMVSKDITDLTLFLPYSYTDARSVYQDIGSIDLSKCRKLELEMMEDMQDAHLGAACHALAILL